MEDSSLSALDSRELDRKLRTLLGEERNVQVDFLLHLDRFDRAHGQEAFGYAKLWDYCRRELGLLNGAIWRRVHAMDLLRRFPAIEARLRDGRISMTALGMLEKVLTTENIEELLDSVVGKSTREIEVLVATFNAPVPTPRAAAAIRKLPARKVIITDSGSSAIEGSGANEGADDNANSEASVSADTNAGSDRGDARPVLVEIGTSSASAEAPGVVPPFVGPQRRGRVVPLSKDQYSIKLFVPREFIDKLEAAQKLVSHQVPGGEVEKVIGVALDRLLRDGARRTRESRGDATTRGVPRRWGGKAGDRYIPAAVRRQVRERDGNRCCWVLASGGLCGSEHQLEIDHILALARGGTTTLENLRVTCRAHNQMNARTTFGREHMARFGA